jgi:hypothetical protein
MKKSLSGGTLQVLDRKRWPGAGAHSVAGSSVQETSSTVHQQPQLWMHHPGPGQLEGLPSDLALLYTHSTNGLPRLAVHTGNY